MISTNTAGSLKTRTAQPAQRVFKSSFYMLETVISKTSYLNKF